MFQMNYPSMTHQCFDRHLATNPGTNHFKCHPANSRIILDTKSGCNNTTPSTKPLLTFSIDRILGLESSKECSHQGNPANSEDGLEVHSFIDNVHDMCSHDGLDRLCQENIDTGFSNIDGEGGSPRYQWLQCTRYHPPKLQRRKKKGETKMRKLDRSPRVPFTQHQLSVLEERFGHTQYLSSMDVSELSRHLSMTETRVKIWFQNRRARHRREVESSMRNHNTAAHKTFQPLLSIPSVTWPMTSPVAPSHYGHYQKTADFQCS